MWERGRAGWEHSAYSGTSGAAIGGVHAAGIPARKYSMVAPTGKVGTLTIASRLDALYPATPLHTIAALARIRGSSAFTFAQPLKSLVDAVVP